MARPRKYKDGDEVCLVNDSSMRLFVIGYNRSIKRYTVAHNKNSNFTWSEPVNNLRPYNQPFLNNNDILNQIQAAPLSHGLRRINPVNEHGDNMVTRYVTITDDNRKWAVSITVTEIK